LTVARDACAAKVGGLLMLSAANPNAKPSHPFEAQLLGKAKIVVRFVAH